jgi:UDP:flavonoid glycosyltransferase YjiC (YdhE family)
VHISFPGYNFPFQFESQPTHVFVGFISKDLNESDYRQQDFELKRYLDELPSNTEVVYVAFGSVVKAEFFLLDVVVQGILHSRDNLTVVLSWPGFKVMPPNWPPDRVRVETWIHQLMVLKHNRTKLFITHGGIRSMGEAISSHRPVIVVPQYGDQMGNCLLSMRAGIGLCITDPQDLTVEVMEERVTAALSNYSSFSDAVKVVDRLRQLAGGVRRACDLIESVSQDVNRPHWVYTNQDKLDSLFLILTILFIIGFCIFWRRCHGQLQAVSHPNKSNKC